MINNFTQVNKNSMTWEFPKVTRVPSKELISSIARIGQVIEGFDGFYLSVQFPESGFILEKYFIDQEFEYEVVGPFVDDSKDNGLPEYMIFLVNDHYPKFNPLLQGYCIRTIAFRPESECRVNVEELNIRDSNEYRLFKRWFVDLYPGHPPYLSEKYQEYMKEMK
jgi:hypothetical protein